MSTPPFVKTSVVRVDADCPDPESVRPAAEILRAGGLVAFATETVYGLGAAAIDPQAVSRIFAAKGRPSFNPLIVHVGDVEQARELVSQWPTSARILADRFWPGPLTLVLPKSNRIPADVTAGQETVGIRIPATKVARALIQAAGVPIAAPSANRSNRISPTRAEHVFADLQGRIDMILDSGPTSEGIESTVVDLSCEVPRILRPGPISAEMLGAALELESIQAAKNRSEEPSSEGFRSPGQLAVHYAPRTRTLRCEPNEGIKTRMLPERCAVLELGSAWREGFSADDDGDKHGQVHVPIRVHLETPEEAARRLYDELHRLDEQRVDLIVVLMPPDRPEWSAIRDRLERAASPWK